MKLSSLCLGYSSRSRTEDLERKVSYASMRDMNSDSAGVLLFQAHIAGWRLTPGYVMSYSSTFKVCMEPEHAAAYVLMTKIYLDAGCSDKAEVAAL